MQRDEIPTPALLLDLPIFEKNLWTLADHCRWHHCAFRPHVKSHKCTEIAKKQIAAGAVGVCVATLLEAEAMARADVPGVLLTSPVIEPSKIARLMTLLRRRNDLMITVAHPSQIERLAAAAEPSELTVNVLIDLDVGDKRTGILPELAEGLAKYIGEFPTLKLVGMQAYAGHASHVVGWSERTRVSRKAVEQAVAVRHQLEQAGYCMKILTCGSTGTYNIDAAVNGVTEVQPGSYIFMDLDYQRIGGQNQAKLYGDFGMSLTVLTSVVSTTYSQRVTVDAGIKSMATDVEVVPVVKDRPELTYRRAGDEFGIVTVAANAKRPSLGDRLELYVPHCDPTVNLYDRIYAMRENEVEAVWTIVRGYG
jgi:D-serine deaminase-like pyridoxal phosphate-dependent protein